MVWRPLFEARLEARLVNRRLTSLIGDYYPIMPFFLVRNVMVFNMASSVATVSQMQKGIQKRSRKTNWSDSEITVLTEKVEENLDLIRSKFSNNVTNAKKNAAWLEITEAVNAVGVAYRTVQEVRDKWKNLTSTAKERIFRLRKRKKKPVEVRPQKSHQMRRLRSSR